MKKNIILTMVLISSIFSYASDKYYYCSGKKVPLEMIPERTVVISEATLSPLSEEPQDNKNIILTTGDSRFSIQVIESSAHTATGVVRNQGDNPKKCHFESCYKDRPGMELIPTGYINVEIKEASDYPLLKSISDEYGL